MGLREVRRPYIKKGDLKKKNYSYFPGEVHTRKKWILCRCSIISEDIFKRTSFAFCLKSPPARGRKRATCKPTRGARPARQPTTNAAALRREVFPDSSPGCVQRGKKNLKNKWGQFYSQKEVSHGTFSLKKEELIHLLPSPNHVAGV